MGSILFRTGVLITACWISLSIYALPCKQCGKEPERCQCRSSFAPNDHAGAQCAGDLDNTDETSTVVGHFEYSSRFGGGEATGIIPESHRAGASNHGCCINRGEKNKREPVAFTDSGQQLTNTAPATFQTSCSEINSLANAFSTVFPNQPTTQSQLDSRFSWLSSVREVAIKKIPVLERW